MDSGTKSISSIPCLVCNTLVFDSDDNQRLSSSSSSSYLEDKRIIVFLLRNLLEIPNPFLNFGGGDDDESKVDGGQGQLSRNSCSKYLVTCEQCKETIKQASLIYSQIRDSVRKFRGIQREIVEAFKTCNGTGTTGGVPEFFDAVTSYRNLVNDCDYNGFGVPFIVQDDDDEDDLDSRKAQPCEVIVKQEDDGSGGNQEMLLLFPEVEEEEDHEGQVSQMDSDSDEEEDEKDRDCQSSELNSEDDEDDQFSQDDPESDEENEDDLGSPIDSEEDDDNEQNVDLPQNNRQSGSKKEALPPTNHLLSSFICKKCLERFATIRELEEHDKIIHFKEERGKFPCPLEGCTKTYTNVGVLPRHFTLHHRRPPFICKDCKQEFTSVDQVRIHHKQTHPPLIEQPVIKPEKIEKRQNQLASQKIRKRRSLQPKVKVKKPRGRPLKIPKQEKQPKKVNQKRCRPDNPFPCPHCPYRLKNFPNLRNHLKTSHPNNQISLDDLRLKFYPPCQGLFPLLEIFPSIAQ